METDLNENGFVFPTHVGMNRVILDAQRGMKGVPHTRGDEPSLAVPEEWEGSCSPHTWG